MKVSGKLLKLELNVSCIYSAPLGAGIPAKLPKQLQF